MRRAGRVGENHTDAVSPVWRIFASGTGAKWNLSALKGTDQIRVEIHAKARASCRPKDA